MDPSPSPSAVPSAPNMAQSAATSSIPNCTDFFRGRQLELERRHQFLLVEHCVLAKVFEVVFLVARVLVEDPEMMVLARRQHESEIELSDDFHVEKIVLGQVNSAGFALFLRPRVLELGRERVR